MKRNDANAVLRECEAKLRALVAEAATDGDYAAVQRLADLARAVAGLVAETAPAAEPPKSAAPDVRAVKPAPRPAKRAGDVFPQFYRRGDDLIKVGWSKKVRRKYQHRAPRPVVELTAEAIRRVGAGGRPFTGDSLLPVKNPADGTDLPAYQVYVALAWMKQLGLVNAIGQRGGYTLGAEKGFDAALTAAWPKLTEWTG